MLSHLHRTDGSATFSQNGYTVIGSVNGPIEVQRRDELPEEAAVDVIVRPAAGIGGVSYLLTATAATNLYPGTRERHLEAILQSTFRQIILIQNFPRTLIQITLQITSTPEDTTSGSKLVQASSVRERRLWAKDKANITHLEPTPPTRITPDSYPSSAIRLDATFNDDEFDSARHRPGWDCQTHYLEPDPSSIPKR
ncbi:hypothetical protein B7494_g949 [Chlorociboria aeruginascens]|nr:hypothetical protein B7494_g949 [Chlorociboria aeruginascens]